MRTLGFGGVVLLLAGIAVVCIVAAMGAEDLFSLFKARDMLTDEGGRAFVWATLGAVLLDLACMVWCWARLCRDPSASAAFNIEFDPRPFFWRYFFMGVGANAIAMLIAAIRGGTTSGEYFSSFVLAAIIFAVVSGLHFLLLLLIPVPSFRHVFFCRR